MSSYGLSSETKKSIKSTVLALRKLLEGEFDPDTGDPIPPGGDVARQIARYGILVNKPESLKSENAPEYLTDEEKKKRERISAAIKREVAIFGELSDKAALKRGMRAFVRQTSYTWINRLLGLRCMEARGLLKDDRGELDFVVTPSDDYGGLPRRAWRIKGEDPAKWQTAKLYDLQCEAIADACRQLTQEIKVLFDPEHDYGLIWPSAPALNTLLQKIQELDMVATPSPFTSPDFLGWVYQYFQTIEKDLVFKAASKKKKKIEKDDIIPATQIYTEHYMVEYLVQNTLGRFWMEMHPDSKLSAKWAYYVKPPEENPPIERKLKKAIEIKLMDPAVGSGHFHLVAFDLLLDMYEEEIENAGQLGWPDIPSVEDKKNIPAAILEQNLFGIDIDARSIQLSSLVLVMKARESGYDGPIGHLNLVVANSAPFESEAWYQFIQNLEKEGKHSVVRVLAALGIKLMNLDEFGSLLRIEDEMQKIIQEEKSKWIAQAEAGKGQMGLFPELDKPKQQRIPFEKAITDEAFFDRLGSVIHKELDTFYLRARQDGLAEDAIMAADAERGFDFARLSMQRYDVVCTNPPYMGSKNMGDRLKKFVANVYPQGKRDLYAAFIMRCCELSGENGYVGMVTQQSWMFLKSFADLRALSEEKLKKSKSSFTGLLRETAIETLAHLGSGAFSEISGAVVNIALFTFRNAFPEHKHQMTAFRLIGRKGSDDKVAFLLQGIRTLDKSTYQVFQNYFLRVPNAIFIYWFSLNFLEILSNYERIIDRYEIREGPCTGDDIRWLRYFWEVTDVKEWRSFPKGGGYKKWNGLDFYTLRWGENGKAIKEFPGSIIPNESWYFKAGLTYTEAAQGALGVRYLAETRIPGNKAPGLFPIRESNELASAVLNCRVVSFLARAMATTIDFGIGPLRMVPMPTIENQTIYKLETLANLCFKLKHWLVRQDQVDRSFDFVHEVISETDSLLSAIDHYMYIDYAVMAILHTLEGISEKLVFGAYKLNPEDIDSVIKTTGTPAGWHPLLTKYNDINSISLPIKSIPKEWTKELSNYPHASPSIDELSNIKKSLKMLHDAGPGAKAKHDKRNIEANESLQARIPIPHETFLEELSQKLQIHPVSVYLLLKEINQKEGLICQSELKRYAEDYVSFIIHRMIGYQWPKQTESGEPLPDWADDDGIIPLTDGLGEATLLDRIRNRFGADFGEEKESSIESEFSNIVGKSLERWLEEDFFARHVKQFKNRPIAWHIVSDPSAVNHEAGQGGKGKKKGGKKKQKPAFSVMVHYHRFVDGDKGFGKLLILKNKYLEKLMSLTRSELESLRGKGDDPKTFDRIAELDRKLIELEDFRERLERIQEGKDRESRVFVRWKTSEEQPQGWRPDINDGVKINIAPWERLWMFPVKKIVGKVEMAPE